jgi:hypothetical protein
VCALPAYLHNHLQGCRSRSASTPSASDLLACGPLLCIRTRLQKRAESATGRTLLLASMDVLVQIRSDLHLRFATFPSARRAITILLLPQRPRSVRIRAAPFVVFSSTASDVLHTRPCCSRANPPCTLCSGSSASSCLTCVRPALPHHSRARTRVFAPPGPTPASAKPLARARQSRLQRPVRVLRSTPVHTTHFRTPSLARSRHPLGVAHVPLQHLYRLSSTCHTRFIKNINRAIIYAPGSSHAYIQQNHQDITTHITNNININRK